MTECREEKIEKFIELLKKYETPKDRFNPWQQYDKSDISLAAPVLRCDNLKKYLMERPKPKYILIGESPSIGARYTGIAMTSEEIFKNSNLFNEYACTSKVQDWSKPAVSGQTLPEYHFHFHRLPQPGATDLLMDRLIG